jgi:hypothetical protein
LRKAILRRFVYCCVLYLACSTLSFAQVTPPQKLTLDAAVDLAEGNYPAIRVPKAQAQAASEQVGLAQTAYLPRLDFLRQENRASLNNIFGELLSQGIIPSRHRLLSPVDPENISEQPCVETETNQTRQRRRPDD